MAEAQEPHKPPPDKTRRAVMIATVGIVVIMGLAVFYVAIVVPLRQTHRVVRAWTRADLQGVRVPVQDSLGWGGVARAYVLHYFGDPEYAAKRLQAYLRLPLWLKPDRNGAMSLLGGCGPEARWAVPMLVEALGDDNLEVRYIAAWVLGEIGPEAKEAVPALENLLAVPHESGFVRDVAHAALENIRGSAAEPDAPEESP